MSAELAVKTSVADSSAHFSRNHRGRHASNVMRVSRRNATPAREVPMNAPKKLQEPPRNFRRFGTHTLYL